MEPVKLLLEDDGNGMFYIMEEGESLGEMKIKIDGNELCAEHTEVLPKAEGKGLGKQLFDAMIAYTREKGLKLKAMCPFVHARLKKNAEAYQDVWDN